MEYCLSYVKFVKPAVLHIIQLNFDFVMYFF